MNYYTVDYNSGQKLGISVVARDENVPNLGNIVVENVQDLQSFSYKSGVRAGDFIVAVNGWYIAQFEHQEGVGYLQNAIRQQRGVRIIFCRPNPSEWTAYVSCEDRVLHEGILHKSGGLFHRKTPRYMKLTKLKLEMEKDGSNVKSFPVTSLGITVSAPNFFMPPKTTFVLVISSSELELECNDLHGCVLWQHAVYCATRNVFSEELPKFYAFNAEAKREEKQSNHPYQQPPPMYPSEPKPELPPTSNQVSSLRSLGNPYHLLLLSKVEVNEKLRPKVSNGDAAKTDLLKDPLSLFSVDIPKVDLSLERSLVGK